MRGADDGGSGEPSHAPSPFAAPLVVIGALALGGQAQSQTPATASIVAAEGVAFTTPSGGLPNVTITAGGTVAFSHAAGPFAHNVRFTGAQPASCVQTVFASASGPVPPLPSAADSGAWAGSCTFAAAGTYTFNCALHGNAMTGSVTVVAPPPPPAPAAADRRPRTAPAAAAAVLRGHGRGRVVAARRRCASAARSCAARSTSAAPARACWRGRSRAAGRCRGGSSTTEVRVARQSRVVGRPRPRLVRLTLNASARRALRRNGRLAITLRLTVTPPTGASYTAKRSVVMRPRCSGLHRGEAGVAAAERHALAVAVELARLKARRAQVGEHVRRRVHPHVVDLVAAPPAAAVGPEHRDRRVYVRASRSARPSTQTTQSAPSRQERRGSRSGVTTSKTSRPPGRRAAWMRRSSAANAARQESGPRRRSRTR